MKASKLISLMVLLFFQAAVTIVFAQDKPKAGDTISGIICDSIGPMIWVNVVELDSLDSVVAHTVTDFSGNFSFRLVNPDDTTFFEIKMKEWDELPQVEMNTDSGYPYKGIPIPIREAAKSVSH